MKKDDLEILAIKVATNLKVDVPLILAICEVESGWDEAAYRFEPKFKEQYVDKLQLPKSALISDISERVGRATSWGLMQIMGQKAREFGFADTFLTGLILEPERNLFYGCKIVQKLFDRYKKLPLVISAYNAGSPSTHNRQYVDRVLREREEYEKRLYPPRNSN